MATLTISPAIIVLGAIALLSVFVIIYLRFTSEFMNKGRFTKGIAITLALFVFLSFLQSIIHAPKPDKIRITVFPLIDIAYKQDTSWLCWAISDQANSVLTKSFSADTLVYPIHWLYEAADADSFSDEKYLLQYAHRIKLDYAAFGSLQSDCDACSLRWAFVDIKRDSVIYRKSEAVAGANKVAVGVRLAADILKYFGKTSPEKPDHSFASIEVVKFRTKALQALSNKEYKKAADYAEQAYKADSTDVYTRNILSRVELHYALYLDSEGKPSGMYRLIALKTSEGTILNYDSTNAEAYRIIGKYYILEKMWGKAEAKLKKALELDPDNPRIYADYSRLHRSRMKSIGFKNEEQLLKYAFSLDPAFENARLQLADYLYFNKWPSQAEKVIRQLLAIHPTSIEAWLFLGRMAVGEHDIQKVIKTYNKILKIDPRNAEAYYNLGVFYYNSNDIDNAERFFNRAVQVGNSLDAHLYLGHIYESQGLIDKAIEEYRLRIRFKKGFKDPYAEEARERLYILTHADSVLKTSNAKIK